MIRLRDANPISLCFPSHIATWLIIGIINTTDHGQAADCLDLRKHFKKYPEDVLSLARTVMIIRVNEETLKLYVTEEPAEFREGLGRIFNKDSYEIFKVICPRLLYQVESWSKGMWEAIYSIIVFIHDPWRDCTDCPAFLF